MLERTPLACTHTYKLVPSLAPMLICICPACKNRAIILHLSGFRSPWLPPHQIVLAVQGIVGHDCQCSVIIQFYCFHVQFQLPCCYCMWNIVHTVPKGQCCISDPLGRLACKRPIQWIFVCHANWCSTRLTSMECCFDGNVLPLQQP